MGMKDNRPRIDDLPTVQIVEVEVPDRLKELEDRLPLDPSVVDDPQDQDDDEEWRWN